MPHSFSCERILATVDWAHAELREQGRFSGYAMDSLLACVDKETSRPGLFARYLRGENSPSRKMLNNLAYRHGSSAVERMDLPLYEVLRRGHANFLTLDPFDKQLLDIETRLNFRLKRYLGEMTYATVEPTRARALTLASYGDSTALAALLMWAPSKQIEDPEESTGDPTDCLVIGQRAYQCLILSMANGEFPQTGPVLAARIRQQVLDSLSAGDRRLDTASIDIEAAVSAGRCLLEQASKRTTLAKKRRILRIALAGHFSGHVDTMTPKIVLAEEADQARRKHPVKLAFGAVPMSKANLVSGYGSNARNHLRAAMGDYLESVPATDDQY